MLLVVLLLVVLLLPLILWDHQCAVLLRGGHFLMLAAQPVSILSGIGLSFLTGNGLVAAVLV